MNGTKVDRWRRLRTAAVDLFEEHGFAAVSIDDIAARAGVSRRTFFNHFETKAAALFDPDPDEQAALAEHLAAHAGQPVWAALTAALEEHLVSTYRVVAARRRIIDAEPGLDQRHVVANARFQLALRRWLEDEGLDTFRARVVAGIALACVRETFMSWQPDAGLDAMRRALAQAFSLAAAGTADVGGPGR